MNDSSGPDRPPENPSRTPGRRVATRADRSSAKQRLRVGDDSRIREVRGTRDARSGVAAPMRTTRFPAVGHGADAGSAAGDGADRRDDPSATVERPRIDLRDHPETHERTPQPRDDPPWGEHGGDESDEQDAGAHPVLVPLAGFFTGMVYVLVLPVLWFVLSDPDGIADLVSVDLVYFVPAALVPIVLALVRRTRRFGRYMLLGVALSGFVVVGVAALVVTFLVVTGQ